jgi:hypothetical protein
MECGTRIAKSVQERHGKRRSWAVATDVRERAII